MSILGTIVSDFKKAGEDVKNFLTKASSDAPAIVQAVGKDAAAVEQIVENYLPGSTKAIATFNTLGDTVAQAVEDAGPAATANGLNVPLSESLINDIKAVIASAKAAAKTV